MPNTSPPIVAMTLLVVTEPKPPIEWPRIENAPGGRRSGSSFTFSASAMIDADAEVVLPVLDHVLDDGEDVARPHVAAAQPRRAVINPRNAVDLLLAVLAGHRIAERGLDFARQMIAGRRKRIVHPLDAR